MHILLNRGAMFDVATRMSRSMSILMRYLDLLLLPQKNRLYTSMTLQKAQEDGKLYSLQVETQIEP